MKIYLAGVPGGGRPGNCKREIELLKVVRFDKRLHSYFHLLITKGVLFEDMKANLKKKKC